MASISINVGQVKKTNKHQDLYDIYELSQKFYQNNINTEFGKKAKESDIMNSVKLYDLKKDNE